MVQTSWIEIPVTNLERSMAFYQTVFNLPTTEIFADDVRRITILPSAAGSAGVSLNQTANFTPSDTGTLVYFHLETDLQEALDRVEAAGGSIVESKNARPVGGYFATVKDSEGNLFVLNSTI